MQQPEAQELSFDVEPVEEVTDAEPQQPEAQEPAVHAPVEATQSFPPPEPVAIVYPTQDEVREALKSHVERGLVIKFISDDGWYFSKGIREASGNMKMPLKHMILQANLLLQSDSVSAPE